MSDAFISYSRADEAFARRLDATLKRLGKHTWVDWRDIPPSADWMAQIYRAIEDANVFLFVLSPDSVASEVCARELAHAAANNKRIIPLMCRTVDPRTVPAAAARPQWIRFNSDQDFDEAVAKLTEGLERDPAWTKAHTHWLQRAGQWERDGRDKSLLLRGRELQSAEAWLAEEKPGVEPMPTALQREFIYTSRTASVRRQRMTTGAIATALVISAGLAILAFAERNEAVTQKRIAQSLALTAAARESLGVDPSLSARLAVEAVKTAHTADAESTLRLILGKLPHRAQIDPPGNVVYGAAFSHDGLSVVTVSDTRTIAIWSAKTGEQIADLQSADDVTHADLSPDGDLVVTTGIDEPARILDVRSGEELMTLGHGGSASVASAEFSPTGRSVVTVGRDEIVRLWDLGRGDEVWELGSDNSAAEAKFSDDGEKVLAVGRSTAQVIDADNGKQIRKQVLHVPELDPVDPGFDPTVDWTGAAFSIDGKLAAEAGSNGSVWIFDAESGKQIKKLHHGIHGVGVTFSPDGRRLVTSGDTDSVARIWDARSGKETRALRGTGAEIRDAGFSADSRSVVTAGADGTARIWSVSGDQKLLPTSGASLRGAAFSPDGERALVAGRDGGVQIFDIDSGEEVGSVRGHWASAAAFSPDGERVVVVDDGEKARIFDIESGDEVQVLPNVADPVLGTPSAGFSPDGALVLAVAGKGLDVVRIYSAATGDVVRVLGGRGDVESADFSLDGSRVLTTGGDEVRIFDIESGKEIQVLQGHGDRINDAAFSPDGELAVTADTDGKARIFDIESGKEIQVLRGHGDPINSAYFSPDGELVVTASGELPQGSSGFTRTPEVDATVRIWHAGTGGQIAVLRGFREPVWSASFSPDGKRILAVSQDGSARVWTCGAQCTGDADLLDHARHLAGTLRASERAQALPD